MKNILSIAGSDCSGGAGIQADLKTFSAHGLFGMTVITSVVAENTQTVISYQNIDTKIVREQIDAVFTDIVPDATKIGMLPSPQIMEAVAEKISQYKPANIVLDPVMYAKNGSPLMDPGSIDTLISKVLPLAHLITPNIPEAEKIASIPIHTKEDMEKAAEVIFRECGTAVLLKGGHYVGDAADLLYDGNNVLWFQTERINTKNTHGTGCTLSSAIASNLALGYDLPEAVKRSKDYITMAIRHSLEKGKGNGPTNHFYQLYKDAGVSNQ